MIKKEIKIICNKDLLESNNISLNDFREDLQYLSMKFKNKFLDFFPLQINDISTVWTIQNLSSSLKKLENCVGFDAHMSVYCKEQFGSNFFVTLFAGSIKDKVQSLELEPEIESTGKNPDVLIRTLNQEIYLECKNIETEQFVLEKEHEHIFNIISKGVDSPNQIDITYYEELTDKEWIDLAKNLNSLLENVTEEGYIINNKKLQVHTIPRSNGIQTGFTILMNGMIEDTNSKTTYPGHIFMKDGRSISISGPLVDFKKIIKKKIEKSRKQSDNSKPYVLVINSNHFIGKKEENMSFIRKLFQPDSNTRFSAILLVNYSVSKEENIHFELITNPYSKNPLGEASKLIFRQI